MQFRGTIIAAVVALLGWPAAAQPPSPEVRRQGEEIYKSTCAVCHDNPQGRTPGRHAISITRSADYLLRVLNEGVMRPQAAALTAEQKVAVAAWLVNSMPGSGADIDVNANRCSTAPAPLELRGPAWNGWGARDTGNLRHQAGAGITASSLRRLELKWAFALPGGAFSQPAVAGGRLFVPSIAGVVFALDARTGCTHWASDVGAPTRTPITIGRAGSAIAAFFGDNRGRVHALDVENGRPLWSVPADDHAMTRLTGAPMLHEGRLYVPVSSYEESPVPSYRCCTFRGSIIALDAATGQVVWKSYTLDDAAQPLADGHRLGPSGVAIWHAPTIDARRRLLYATTGNLYTEAPGDAAVDVSNAVVAFDLDTGAKRWASQLHAQDVSIGGCWPPGAGAGGRNCPSAPGPDFDLGGPPLLVTRGGRDHLVAASKSGDVFGLDPDAGGKVLWRTQLGRGSALGGIEWGGASDGRRVYFPIGDGNDIRLQGPAAQRGPAKPGLNAVAPGTGKLLWHTPAPAPVCGWQGPCTPAMTAAPLVVSDVVFAGSADGHERAYSARDGRQLWEFDTGRSFDAVNGGKATGGAIDQGGQVVAGDMLFVTSGGRAQPGNALLAFAIDR